MQTAVLLERCQITEERLPSHCAEAMPGRHHREAAARTFPVTSLIRVHVEPNVLFCTSLHVM